MMKQALVASLFACALALAATPALACNGKLGVARTIAINAEAAPLHGAVQYDAPSLLRDGEVVFTFDDGPLPVHTRKILSALKDHCTKATFFMVGRMAVANPAMVREVAAYGHTIATHTWSHKNLKQRRTRRGAGEIELGISAIQHALGEPVAPFFRFPYLAESERPDRLQQVTQNRDVLHRHRLIRLPHHQRCAGPAYNHAPVGQSQEGHPSLPRYPDFDRPGDACPAR